MAGYGLGLIALYTDCGPLWGHIGGLPGFNNEFFSSEDGRRQYGLMVNAEIAPAAVWEAYFPAFEQALAEAFGRPCVVPEPSSGAQPAAAAGATRRSMADGGWQGAGGSRKSSRAMP